MWHKSNVIPLVSCDPCLRKISDKFTVYGIHDVFTGASECREDLVTFSQTLWTKEMPQEYKKIANYLVPSPLHSCIKLKMQLPSLSTVALSVLVAANAATLAQAKVKVLSWDDAYKKADALVGQMSLEQKVNITTGEGWMVCDSRQYKVYSLD